MRSIHNNKTKLMSSTAALAFLAAGLFAAQTTNGTWRRLSDPQVAQVQTPPPPPVSTPDGSANGNYYPQDQTTPPPPPSTSTPPPSYYPQHSPGASSSAPPPSYYPQQSPGASTSTPPPSYYPQQSPTAQNEPPVPAQLTIRPGTFLTVRINQPLSSDHNQPGDAFTATLVRPLVIDGVVIAEPGQTIAGRVTEARKAGRVEGVSRLGVQLTELTLVDGQQVPIQSAMVTRTGPTSVGRDAGAIAGTTAVGAAAGAAADWGRGAAIGAGAGAVAGIVGVLLTRGHATIIYPEQVLTFRVEQPVLISTERAPQVFHYVGSEPMYQQGGYGQGAYGQGPPRPRPGYGASYGPGYGYPPPPPPVAYAAPYPYYYGPRLYPYWGPSFGFFFGGPRVIVRGGGFYRFRRECRRRVFQARFRLPRIPAQQRRRIVDVNRPKLAACVVGHHFAILFGAHIARPDHPRRVDIGPVVYPLGGQKFRAIVLHEDHVFAGNGLRHMFDSRPFLSGVQFTAPRQVVLFLAQHGKV